MVERYPAVEPCASGLLEVSDGHRLYWQTVGNPAGTPAVHLHGGPGGGCSPGTRRNSDPEGFGAVLQWCIQEDVHMSLTPGATPRLRHEPAAFRAVFARLVTHYRSHGCFLAAGEIRNAMDRPAGIPAVLAHGRHDISGPLETAWQVHRAWPASRLVVPDDAGHGGGGFGREIVAAPASVRALS